MVRKLTLGLFGLLALGLSLLLTRQLVTAHAEYDHSDPAADAVLTVAPTQVQIWFTQELFRRKGLNKLTVYTATEQRVDLDDATIDDDDRTLMRVSLPPSLAAGRYTVRWQATSAEDGHEGQGEFRFTIATTTDAATTASAMSTTVTTTTGITVAAVSPAATPTTATPPTATAVPTLDLNPAATPTPAPTSGLTCFGSAAPLLMVVGALFVPRRRRFQ